MRIACLALALALACAREDVGAEGASRAEQRPSPVLPAPRAGADVLGSDVRAFLPDRWATGPVAVGAEGGPRATLLRFWTDSCPFCEASLPALESLRTEFADDGLVVIGIYHPKPPRPVEETQVRAAAVERGFGGPVAIDAEWASLRRIWLDTGDRSTTSASFLLDAEGKIRFVHPGPELHPGGDPDHERCREDFDALRQAVQAVLAEGRA